MGKIYPNIVDKRVVTVSYHEAHHNTVRKTVEIKMRDDIVRQVKIDESMSENVDELGLTMTLPRCAILVGKRKISVCFHYLETIVAELKVKCHHIDIVTLTNFLLEMPCVNAGPKFKFYIKKG